MSWRRGVVCEKLSRRLQEFGKKLLGVQRINISETVRASAKIHGMAFKDLDICQRMIPLQKLHLMTLTYFFKSIKWNFNISDTVRASTSETMFSTWRIKQPFSFVKWNWTLSCRFASMCMDDTLRRVALVVNVITHRFDKTNTTFNFVIKNSNVDYKTK